MPTNKNEKNRFFTAPVASPMALILALMTGAFAVPSFAGSLVILETRDPRSDAATPDRVSVSVDGDAIRMDAVGGTADDAGSMVFKADVNEMMAIDHSRKEYVVLDEAALESISGQINDAMSQMQEALAELPPEQRAMAERMMKQRMGPMAAQNAPPPRSVTRTGQSETVNGYECDVWAVTESGRMTRDMCVTGWANIDGGEDYARIMVRMACFFEDMRAMISRNGMDLMGPRSDVFSHMRDINGFPVRSRNYNSAGEVTEESTLVSSESKAIDPAIFSPPADYTRQMMQR